MKPGLTRTALDARGRKGFRPRGMSKLVDLQWKFGGALPMDDGCVLSSYASYRWPCRETLIVSQRMETWLTTVCMPLVHWRVRFVLCLHELVRIPLLKRILEFVLFEYGFPAGLCFGHVIFQGPRTSCKTTSRVVPSPSPVSPSPAFVWYCMVHVESRSPF